MQKSVYVLKMKFDNKIKSKSKKTPRKLKKS